MRRTKFDQLTVYSNSKILFTFLLLFESLVDENFSRQIETTTFRKLLIRLISSFKNLVNFSWLHNLVNLGSKCSVFILVMC